MEAARRGFRLDLARSLLDVGGGTGWLAEELGKGLARVTVLEPRGRARAKGQKLRPAIEFVDGVAERLPFGDGEFDRVMAIGSFHHFADGAKGLAEIGRVLAPGGRLLLFEFSPEKGQGKFLVRFACHHSLKSPQELGALVTAAGFEVLQMEEVLPRYIVTAARL